MGSETKSYDVAIVGLGVYGSAIAWQLAARGANVVGVDQFDPPHTNGSSHGGTRISRFATFEGQAYVDSALETARMYDELRGNSAISDYLKGKYGDDHMFVPNGTMIMGPASNFNKKAHGTDNAVQQTISIAREIGVRHELLDGHDIVRRFPSFVVPEADRADTIGYYEPGSGTLFPERCVDAQLHAARLSGAHVLTNHKVEGIDEDGMIKTLRMRNAQGEAVALTADRVVISAGAWIGDFMPMDMRSAFNVQRQVFGWFKSNAPQDFSIDNHPNYIRFVRTDTGGIDYFYGFPNGVDSVKVARENGVNVDPHDVTLRQTWEGELDTLFKFVSPHIKGLQRAFAHSAACRYTLTGNQQFRIEPHPKYLDSYFVSACSGYGFKHALSIGAAIAGEMTGVRKTGINLQAFGWEDKAPPLDMSSLRV